MKRKDEARSELSQSAGEGALRREDSLVSRGFGEGSMKPVLDPGLKIWEDLKAFSGLALSSAYPLTLPWLP